VTGRASLLLVLALSLAAAPTLATDDMDSAPLFAVAYTGLDGQPVAAESLRDGPLFVSFWARWCEPCRREIPALEHLQHSHPGVRIVAIALEHDAAAVREFAQAYGMTYRIVLVGEAGPALLAALGNEPAGLPFALAIRRDGRIAGRFLGPMSPSGIEAVIAALAAAD